MTFPEIQLELHGKLTAAPSSASTTMLQLFVAESDDVDNATAETAHTKISNTLLNKTKKNNKTDRCRNIRIVPDVKFKRNPPPCIFLNMAMISYPYSSCCHSFSYRVIRIALEPVPDYLDPKEKA